MSLTFKLAWRNLWRNRRRTLINLAAMSTGCIALMVATGLIDGLVEQLQTSVTEALTGDVQVHAKGYLAERNLRETLSASTVDTVMSAARKAALAAAPRSIGYGLVAKGSRSAGVEIMGIDEAAEREFGGLSNRMSSGVFLGGKAQQAVLASKLARTLEANVGDELVVVVQAADGSTGSVLLQVAGILEGVGESVDRTLLLVRAQDFHELFALEGVNEIALTSHQHLDTDAVFRIAIASAPDADVQTWRELLPQVTSVERVWKVASGMIAIIFSLAAGLGVLNAMLMAQYERIPELGLLKSLGTAPARIVSDVFIEALLLGLASIAVGICVGSLVVEYLHAVGIHIVGTTRVSISGVSLGTVWRARWSLGLFVQPALVTLLTALFAAVIPALKAARLNPVEALQHV